MFAVHTFKYRAADMPVDILRCVPHRCGIALDPGVPLDVVLELLLTFLEEVSLRGGFSSSILWVRHVVLEEVGSVALSFFFVLFILLLLV